MASRDLTAHFIRIRASSSSSKRPRPVITQDEALLAGAASSGNAWQGLAPIYVDTADEIQQALSTIEDKGMCCVICCQREAGEGRDPVE